MIARRCCSDFRRLVPTLALACACMMCIPQPAQAAPQSWLDHLKKAEQAIKEVKQIKKEILPSSQKPVTKAKPGDPAKPTPAPADLSSPAMEALYRKLDVVGIRLGMTPKQAVAVIHRHNPALAGGKVAGFRFADLPKTSFVPQMTFQQKSAPHELIYLGLTLTPMKPVVLSIFRARGYPEGQRPTAANTVAALIAKYGPVTERKDSISMQGGQLFWFFDGAGHLVPKSRASKLSWCSAISFQYANSARVGTGESNGGGVDCSPYTSVFANLLVTTGRETNSHGQSVPSGMLKSLTVTVNSYPMLTKTVATSRKMVLAAKKARIQREKKAAQEKAPIL